MDVSTARALATVYLPGPLRARAANRRVTSVAGSTIRELIDGLDQAYPGMRFHLCYETGELRPYVNIFLERENIRYLQGLDTPVPVGAAIYILQSVAGG
jgi:molybdopterin synthase sulfur carrier subunit